MGIEEEFSGRDGSQRYRRFGLWKPLAPSFK
jgi:hypothetical protein